MDKMPAHNMGLEKAGVQCFFEKFCAYLNCGASLKV